MPDHAGFAVAITVRERVLNDSMLLSYHAGTSGHRLAAPIPDGPPPVGVDFFLKPPRIRCAGDDPLRFTLHLEGWGPLTIEWDGTTHVRNIRWQMRLPVRARFTVAGTAITLSPEASDIRLELWSFDVLAGGAFPDDVDLYLRGGVFRNRLQAAVRDAVTLGLVNIPPIDASFLGPVVQAADMQTGARVVEGAIMIGLDVSSDEVTTEGDAGLLADFARNNDVAAVTNPAAVPVTMRAAEQQIRDAAAEHGATLERLDVTAEQGYFRVAGRASNVAGAVDFSLRVVPVMFDGRPGAYLPFPDFTMVVKGRKWPALSFRTADIEVSVDRASWVVLVEVLGALLTGAVIPLIIEDLIRQVTAQVTSASKNATVQTPVPRVRRLPPQRAGDPTVRLEIAEFEIHRTGVFAGITLNPEPEPPALLGLTSLPRNFAHHRVEYRVRLPLDLLPDDPQLRIRWTVIDLDSDTVLVNDDDTAAGRLAFQLTPAAVAPDADRFAIGVRVYRAFGAELVDYLNEGIRLDIGAPLPPGSYVRWRYDVKNPQVRFDESRNAWWYASPSEYRVRRWSAVHRLDRPCQMATKQSRYVYQVEHLDTLPFPLEHILDRRDTVCEYCFFGGPGHLLPSL